LNLEFAPHSDCAKCEVKYLEIDGFGKVQDPIINLDGRHFAEAIALEKDK